MVDWFIDLGNLYFLLNFLWRVWFDNFFLCFVCIINFCLVVFMIIFFGLNLLMLIFSCNLCVLFGFVMIGFLMGVVIFSGLEKGVIWLLVFGVGEIGVIIGVLEGWCCIGRVVFFLIRICFFVGLFIVKILFLFSIYCIFFWFILLGMFICWLYLWLIEVFVDFFLCFVEINNLLFCILIWIFFGWNFEILNFILNFCFVLLFLNIEFMVFMLLFIFMWLLIFLFLMWLLVGFNVKKFLWIFLNLLFYFFLCFFMCIFIFF